MAEDAVVIPVSLEPDMQSTLKAGAQLSKELSDAINEYADVDISDKLRKNLIQAQKFESQLTKVNSKIVELASTSENLIPTDTYQSAWDSMVKYREEAEKITAELEKLKQKQEELSRRDSTMLTNYAKRNNISNRGEAREKLFAENSTYYRLQQSIKDTTAQENALRDSQERVNAELERYKNLVTEIQNNGTAFIKVGDTDTYYTSLTDNLAKSAELTQKLQMSLGAVAHEGGESVQKIISPIARLGTIASITGSKIATLAKNLLMMAKSAIAGGIRRLASSFRGLGKDSEKSGDSFKKAIKLFIKYGFGVRSFFFLFRKIRSAIADSLKTLQDASFGDVGASLNALSTSLQYLKDSWAAAFAPIITFVTPVLTRLMDAFSGIMNTIGAFIALLTGKSFYVKAVKGTGALADKTKAGAEAQKEWNNELYSFDELNRQQDQDDKNKDSGSGGGGGLNFEESPISGTLSEWLEDWGKRLKEAWQNSEFFKFGEIIAEGLNKAIDAIDNWIDNTLRPFAVTWSKNIATILNGVVAGLDWVRLGDMLASGLNILPAVINTFMDTFDFGVFGQRLGEGIKSFVDVVDWEGIGKLFSNKLRRLIEIFHGIVNTPGLWESIGNAISSAVTGWFFNIDWQLAGETLATGFNGLVTSVHTAIQNIPWFTMVETFVAGLNTLVTGVDWAEFGRTVSDALVTALGMIVLALAEFDWQGLGEAIGEFISNIDWGKVALLAVMGLMALASGLFEALISALESVFENIGDKFAEFGDDGIAGFFKGIADALKNLKNWVQENMIDPLVNAVKDLLGIHSPSKVFSEIGTNLVDGLFEGIKNTWSKITGFFDQSLGPLVSKIQKAWSDLKTKTSTTWGNIKTAISNTWTNTKNTLFTTTGNIRTDVTNAWNNLKTTTATSWNNIKTTVTNSWNNLKTNLRSVSFSDIGRNLVDGIKSGVGGAWDSLVSSVNRLCGSLVDRVRGMFQIHSPSKVFAEIGENLALGLAEGITDESSTPIKAAENMAESVGDLDTAITDMPNALDAVLEKLNQIADRFTTITNALLGVSNMPIPAVASGRVVPSGIFTSGGDSATVATTIADAIVNAFDSQGISSTPGTPMTTPVIKVYIRGKEVFDAVVDENNSAIMRTGTSPLVR